METPAGSSFPRTPSPWSVGARPLPAKFLIFRDVLEDNFWEERAVPSALDFSSQWGSVLVHTGCSNTTTDGQFEQQPPGSKDGKARVKVLAGGRLAGPLPGLRRSPPPRVLMGPFLQAPVEGESAGDLCLFMRTPVPPDQNPPS